MRRTLLLAATIAASGVAHAQPADMPDNGMVAVYDEGADDGGNGGRRSLRGGDTPWQGGLNAFFYPQGYDPQYGSGGRVADAAEFAADYGCRPIWNGKIGRRIPACN